MSYRKVKYRIDDIQWFQKRYKLSEQKTKEIFSSCDDSFKVIYTLIGNGRTVDRYELTDYDGNKININSLNGYQKGAVLNDCYAHFTGGKYQFDMDEPMGVIEIEECEVDENGIG